MKSNKNQRGGLLKRTMLMVERVPVKCLSPPLKVTFNSLGDDSGKRARKVSSESVHFHLSDLDRSEELVLFKEQHNRGFQNLF